MTDDEPDREQRDEAYRWLDDLTDEERQQLLQALLDETT